MEFRKRFRVSKVTHAFLKDLLKEDLQACQTRENCLSVDSKILVGLRFLATGSHQQLVGDASHVSQSSVSRAIRAFVDAINKRRCSFIYFPEENTWNHLRMRFYEIAQFPGCVAALDGTHIPIKKPTGVHDFEIYRCRKGYFSLNCQILCGYNNMIYDIVARWPGSTHDSRIFRNSRLCHRLQDELLNPGIILADGGYACTK
jgi:nuclease HARBI1